MTPLHIQMLLWYHTRGVPYAQYEPDHASSPAVKSYRADLMQWDLIEPDPRPPPGGLEGSGWRTTERGRFYVNALCSLPLPEAVWKIPA